MNNARIGGILLLAFCLFYAWKIGDIRLLPFQANQAFTAVTVPQVLAGIGIFLSVLIIAFPDSNSPRRVIDAFRGNELNWKLGGAFLILMSIYGFTVRPFGFLIATSLFLIAGFALLGERNPVRLILIAVPIVVAFWALMNFGLSVVIEPLPAFLRG